MQRHQRGALERIGQRGAGERPSEQPVADGLPRRHGDLGRCGGHESIAGPVDRQKVLRLGRIHLELLAQPLDGHVDSPRLHRRRIAPDFLQQSLVRHHLAWALDPPGQQIALDRGQMTLPAMPDDLPALDVDVAIGQLDAVPHGRIMALALRPNGPTPLPQHMPRAA
jgi:hypothetical protein